jgi:thiamine kinase-like enzyme
MNEQYKFSETRTPINQSELSANEVKTLDNLGLTFEDLEKLLGEPHFAEGSYAIIFDLPSDEQKNIAKVWKNPKQDSGRAKHENVALRLLRLRNSGEAPKVAGYLKSAGILFEEKIEGNPIETFDKITVGQLAETVSMVHSIELNAYGKPLTQRKKGTKMDYLSSELGKLRENLSLLDDSIGMKSLIEQAIDKIESEANQKAESFQGNDFTLIHFDLNRNNILRSNISNKIILIDWEQASAGDNAIDVAKLFLKLDFDDEQKEGFLAKYVEGFSKTDEYFNDRLRAYEPVVLVNSILWRLRVLRDIPPHASSINEKQFYARVKNNLDKELVVLKKYLS